MGEKKPDAKTGIREMNIYQKLAAIGGDIGIVEKGGTNSEQHYSFIEYAAVAGKLRTLFADYGVVIVPRMPASSTHVREEITTKYGNKGVAVLIDFEFEIINADDASDSFKVTWTGEAADYGDKGTNKAATSALKYYLMRQFNISEKGEDADETTIDRGSVQGGAPAPTKPPAKPKVTFVSKQEIEEIKLALVEKGIESDDTEQTLLRLAKTDDLAKINVASGKAILAKIKKADSSSLREFVYGELNDEGVQDDADSSEGTEPIVQDQGDGEVEPDQPAEDEATHLAHCYQGEYEDTCKYGDEDCPAKPEPEPPLVVDDDMRDAVWEMYESLPLKGQYKLRFLKDVTGVITRKSMTKDEHWRALHDRCAAIIGGDAKLPAQYLKDGQTELAA